MKFDLQRALTYLFSSLCTFTTIGMVSYWGYKFCLNEDSSVVTFREFYEMEEDIHPTISMCLKNPFLKEHLIEYGVNEASYLDFLKGKNFSKEMLDVDFNNVSIDISDYIKDYRIYLKNSTKVKQDKGLALTYSSFTGFLGHSSQFIKCFALRIPKYDNLMSVMILLSNNIFPNGIRPTDRGFRTYVHLPGQFLLSPGNTDRWMWPPRMQNESYRTRFVVSSLSTEMKRNKWNSPCNRHWQDWDDWVMKRHKEETKCNNPYQKQDERLPMCKTQALMRRAVFTTIRGNGKKYEKPCKTMEDARIEYLEDTMDKKEAKSSGEFWFIIKFPVNKFKEIEQTR